MASPAHWNADIGFAGAGRRIAACKAAQADELDPGVLYLARLPGELPEPRWLKSLHLVDTGIGDEGAGERLRGSAAKLQPAPFHG